MWMSQQNTKVMDLKSNKNEPEVNSCNRRRKCKGVALVEIESCGDKHPEGKYCYLRFSWEAPKTTNTRCDCIADIDKDGNLVGLEFYDGINITKSITFDDIRKNMEK